MQGDPNKQRRRNMKPRARAARAAYAASPEGRRVMNEKHRVYRREIRDFIDRVKSRPCADCGGSFDPVCMDFDHRTGEKKSFTIGSNASSIAIDKLTKEIAKCDVVCANCHRIRTFRDRDHRLTVRRMPQPSTPNPQLALLKD